MLPRLLYDIIKYDWLSSVILTRAPSKLISDGKYISSQVRLRLDSIARIYQQNLMTYFAFPHFRQFASQACALT